MMPKLRLRSKFLLALLLVSAGLTGASLLLVRQIVQAQMREEVLEDLRTSTLSFQDFQQQREASLIRSAKLLSNLPTLKALMTTQHTATIQDGSADLWKLAGSSLFVLADRSGKVVALHTSNNEFPRKFAEQSLEHSLQSGRPTQWWLGAGHLYEIFLQPIYMGPETAENSLGVLAVGYEIDNQLLSRISRIANSEVRFRYDQTIVVSTFPPSQRLELDQRLGNLSEHFKDIVLGNERYLATSLELAPDGPARVQLQVFKSYDQATQFLTRIYRSLMALGLLAVLAQGILVFLVSRRFIRPLEALVGGVRALEKGDFAYRLDSRGSDEVAELTGAFDRMRSNLQSTQHRLLEAERLATIGLMASSISHDLRHQLTAIVANAEFLAEAKPDAEQREDFYREIRVAVAQMTDLIESLLEFSRTRESLTLAFGSVEETMRHAIRSLAAQRGFQNLDIRLTCDGDACCRFDARKMERAFHNLLLNACQAVSLDSGRIEVGIRSVHDSVEIRVTDNGTGIPEPIRNRIFEPFVSYGKENGIGLGLTIVQKIVEEHEGHITVECADAGRTAIRITIPVSSNAGPEFAALGEVGATRSPARS